MISAVLLTYNEEHALIDRVTELGLDDLIILDNGSTDHTAKVARALGCRVFDTSGMFLHTATKNDRARFRRAFGFAPTFKAGQSFQHNGERRCWGAEQAKNDWTYHPDCDEYTAWDLDKVIEATKDCEVLNYRFVNGHDEAGNPTHDYVNPKLYDRRAAKWEGWVHEVVVHGGRIGYTEDMRVDHWQRPKEYRVESLAILEYQASLDPSPRNTFYLGRQYIFLERQDDARAVLRKFIAMTPAWRTERAQGYIYLAMIEPDRNLAKGYLHAALLDDDSRRDAWVAMADMQRDDRLYDSAEAYLKGALAIPYVEKGYLTNLELHSGGIERRLAEIAVLKKYGVTP